MHFKGLFTDRRTPAALVGPAVLRQGLMPKTFTQLGKFWSAMFPCKSGFGSWLLKADLVLLPYMVSEIQTQGKFLYKQYVC